MKDKFFKSSVYYGSLILCILLPLLLFWVMLDQYLLISAQKIVIMLNGFIDNMQNGVDPKSIPFKQILKGLFIFIAFIQIIDKSYINNRRNALNLIEQRKDIILNIYFMFQVSVVVYLFYIIATFFEINTESFFESINLLVGFISAGIVLRIYSMVLHNK